MDHRVSDGGPGSRSTRRMAVNATLHCLLGCSIGEVLGMAVSTALHLHNAVSVALSIVLSFIFGYMLSTLPIIKHGVPLKKALLLVLAADTLSILTMEITDNLVMVVVPGAMDATLSSPLFWGSMAASLVVAFCSAVPVNLYLLRKGQGHALVHEYHEGH